MTEHICGLIRIMKEHTDLDIDGLSGERRLDHRARRAALLGAYDQFDDAVRWLSAIPRRKAANRNAGYSYFLKHVVEDWSGSYIANGVLIAAALYLKFPIARCPSGINCWIGVAGKRYWPKRYVNMSA